MADIVTGFKDLSDAVAVLQKADVDTVTAIKSLQAQVAAGNPITGDQLESLAKVVSGVSADLGSAVTVSTSTSS